MANDGVPAKAVEVFEKMSRRIAANEPEYFGGALALVGPDGAVAELLALDSARDALGFLASAQAKIALLVEQAKAEEQARLGGISGFGRR